MGWAEIWLLLLLIATLIAAVAMIALHRPGVWRYLMKRPFRYSSGKRKPPPRGAFESWRIEDWLFAAAFMLLLVFASTSVAIWVQDIAKQSAKPAPQIAMSPEQLAAHDRAIVEALEHKTGSDSNTEETRYALTRDAFGVIKNGAISFFLLLLWISFEVRLSRDSRDRPDTDDRP